MANTQDPLVGFRFSIELQGKVAGYFKEISGLGSKTEVIKHKVVDDKGRERIIKLPGRTDWDDITLKKGMQDGNAIAEWRKKVVNGNMKDARVNFSVVVYDQELKEVARYNGENGWISEYTTEGLKADSNEVIVDTMKITHEGLDKVK